jgi:ATP-dependent DNA helicase RecQ
MCASPVVKDGPILDVAQWASFVHRCLSIDIEVDPAAGRLFAFAAVRPDQHNAFVFNRGRLDEALGGLDGFGRDAEFLLGHNIVRFDLPHLAAVSGGRSGILAKPAIDTLWLNPLAFPRNPYHRLVKHYQDGRLKAGHINDPELDARLVIEVLSDQLDALSELQRRSPHLLVAYHWLTTTRPDESGFDAVFTHLRGEPPHHLPPPRCGERLEGPAGRCLRAGDRPDRLPTRARARHGRERPVAVEPQARGR